MTFNALDRIGLKLARDKEKNAPPPAEASGLGAAIEQLIDTAVEQRLKDAVKPIPVNPRVPPYLRDFTDKAPSSEFPPPVASTTKPPRDLTISTQRDEHRRLKYITIGNDVRFEVQRDGEGRVARLIQLD